MEDKIVKPQMDQAASTQPTQQAQPASEPVKTESEPIKVDKDGEPVAGDMTIPTDPYYTSPLFYEVASYFGLQPESYNAAKNQLSVIVDYAILEGKSNKMEDVLTTIRRVEDKLQPPSWGESRYGNLYKYIRLASKKQSYEKALSAFEKTGGRA